MAHRCVRELTSTASSWVFTAGDHSPAEMYKLGFTSVVSPGALLVPAQLTPRPQPFCVTVCLSFIPHLPVRSKCQAPMDAETLEIASFIK